MARPREADPGTVYSIAHQFYWDFRRIEGGFARPRFDRAKYEGLCKDIDRLELRLTPEQQSDLEMKADEEVRAGRLGEAERSEWIRRAEDSWLVAIREDYRRDAVDDATKSLRVPGEPEIITDLLKAETPSQIREICKDAFVAFGDSEKLAMPNWPIPAGSTLPSYISQYAAEFITARRDRRFPQSTSRPSSRLKQLWFLARALAGAMYGIKTRTAINLVGSLRPDELFEESRAAKPVRRRVRISSNRRNRERGR